MEEVKIDISRRPVGQPTKLTPEVHKTIVNCLKAGNFLYTSAMVAGITRKCLNDWMRRGREFDGKASNRKYLELYLDIRHAIAYAEVRDVNIIDRAAQAGDWKAAAYRLERRSRNFNSDLTRDDIDNLEGDSLDADDPVAKAINNILTALTPADKGNGEAE